MYLRSLNTGSRTAFIFIIFFTKLFGDSITSNDGEILKGIITKNTTSHVEIESPFAGTVSILKSKIAKIEIDSISENQLSKTEKTNEEKRFESRLQSIGAPIEDPKDYSFDWIQISSGEWLKGEIKAMYSNSFEFDSDELELLELDWEDVTRIRTENKFSVRIDKQTTHTGRIAMKDETIEIEAPLAKPIDQFELISIAPDEAVDRNNWTSRISLSSTYRTGSSEQRDTSISGILQKRTSKRRLYFDFLSNYSKTEDNTTSDDLRMNAYFDSFRTKRLFIRPISIEYYRDPLQNLKHRYTLDASIGYHLTNNRKTTWDVTLGPAYQRAEYSDPDSTSIQIEEDPAILFTTQFDTELSKRIDFKGSYKVQYANVTGGLSYHTWTKLEYELTDGVDLDISFFWDRNEDPVTDSSGVTPEKDEIRTTIGIGIEI